MSHMNHDVGKGCPQCALALALFSLKLIADADIPALNARVAATSAIRQIKEKYGFTPADPRETRQAMNAALRQFEKKSNQP